MNRRHGILKASQGGFHHRHLIHEPRMGTKMKQKKQPAPELNEEGIDEAVLALLYLNFYHCGVVWKGFDWDAMNRLHEKGLISDPVRKAKSVGFSEEGEKQARKVFEQMFVISKSDSRAGGRVTNA
jgi:hypothetical protein